jgi:hypothetical protein
VAQQLLEHPVARRRPRAAQIIPRPEQIAQTLELRRRRMHEPQQASAIQGHGLLRVTQIGLDAIARPLLVLAWCVKRRFRVMFSV